MTLIEVSFRTRSLVFFVFFFLLHTSICLCGFNNQATCISFVKNEQNLFFISDLLDVVKEISARTQPNKIGFILDR